MAHEGERRVSGLWCHQVLARLPDYLEGTLSPDELADVEGQLCDDYGVWQEKEKNGERKMGIVRSTFVVDATGTIRHAIYDVKPKGHAEQVLELVRGL